MTSGFSNSQFRAPKGLRLASVKTALDDALAFLGNRQERKLGNNTYLRRDGDGAVVRLHQTDIITIERGRLTLSSGGFRTHTTKERLNGLLPDGYRISSELGIWHLRTPSDGWESSLAFADGCVLMANGRTAKCAKESEQKALLKKVHAYAKLYVNAAFVGALPKPSAGDCWLCTARVVNGPGTGKTLGEACGDEYSHMLNHMHEGYMVPSLLVNAAKECKPTLLTWGLPLLWGANRPLFAHEQSSLKRDISSAVRRYVGRRVGLACR